MTDNIRPVNPNQKTQESQSPIPLKRIKEQLPNTKPLPIQQNDLKSRHVSQVKEPQDLTHLIKREKISRTEQTPSPKDFQAPKKRLYLNKKEREQLEKFDKTVAKFATEFEKANTVNDLETIALRLGKEKMSALIDALVEPTTDPIRIDAYKQDLTAIVLVLAEVSNKFTREEDLTAIERIGSQIFSLALKEAMEGKDTKTLSDLLQKPDTELQNVDHFLVGMTLNTLHNICSGKNPPLKFTTDELTTLKFRSQCYSGPFCDEEAIKAIDEKLGQGDRRKTWPRRSTKNLAKAIDTASSAHALLRITSKYPKY